MLYGAGALAIALGLAVWPGNVHRLGGAHALAGWLTIVSLWTLSGIAARAGIRRSYVWLAVGWGVAAALAASAQFQLRAGSWITPVHVVTAVGVIAFGQLLVARMRHGELAALRMDSVGVPRTLAEAAADFLANRRIAVTGVSRTPGQHGSNIVYRRLRDRGYDVFAINPNASEVEGSRCYRELAAIPGGVDAVVIGTRADRALDTMRECAALGIRHVWMHRSVGPGSVSEEAAAWGRNNGMRVIAGGCPLMFAPASDTGHVIMRSVLTLTGRVPRHV